MELSKALVMVTGTELVTPRTRALMLVCPTLTPLTRPLVLTAAVEALALLKVAERVTSAVLPSL
jgi:hypothetical protein